MNALEPWAAVWMAVALRITIGIALGSLAVGALVRFVRVPARTEHLMWTIVLLQGLLWFQVPLTVPAAWLGPLDRPLSVVSPPEDNAHTAATAQSSPQRLGHEVSLQDAFAGWVSDDAAPLPSRLKVIVLMLWATGVLLLACWLLLHGLLFRRRVLATALAAPAQIQAAARLQMSRRKLRGAVRVLTSGRCEVPCLLGTLQPTIVLPTRTVELPLPQLETLLAHELAHVARGDRWWAALAVAARTLNFFNPLAWWAYSQMAVARERSVDHEVVSQHKDARADYARAMLHVAQGLVRPPRTLGLGMARSGVELRARIEEILSSAPLAHRASRTVRSLACLFVAVVALSPITLREQSWVRAANESEPPTSGIPLEVQLRVDRGLKYLAERQQEDGSFGAINPKPEAGLGGRPGLRVPVTSLCGLAMLSSGSVPGRGTYGQQIDKAVKYVVSQQQANGYIVDREGGSMYSHAFATLFLARAYQASLQKLPVQEPLDKAVKLLVETQSDAGGWRYVPVKAGDDMSVTLCQMGALHAARAAGIEVPEETWKRGVDYVYGCQNDDGSFRYVLSMPKAMGGTLSLASGGVAVLEWAGLTQGDEFQKGRTFLETKLQTNTPPGKDAMFYYANYYSAQALWNLGGEAWQSWYAGVQKLLAEHQREDGSWTDAIAPEYGTAMACIILQMPAWERVERGEKK